MDIALVSNGSALLGSGAGPAIDAHRLVARFNEFECGGEYGGDVGYETDIHATGWLLSASRDCPGDRLAAEEKRSWTEMETEMESNPPATAAAAPPALEVRLIPNVVGAECTN